MRSGYYETAGPGTTRRRKVDDWPRARRVTARGSRLAAALMAALAAGLLAGCAGGRDVPIAQRIRSLHTEMPPTPAGFILCAGHGCRERHMIHLTPAEWDRIRARFDPAPPDPAAERAAIARAVAALEALSGAQSGTSADKAGTYAHMFAAHQLDCADETVNVTTYLRMMAADGLLVWHRPAGRVHRGRFIDSLPHMAPTIIDRRTGTAWVVDAWYHDNGEPPEIVPVDVWRTPRETWEAQLAARPPASTPVSARAVSRPAGRDAGTIPRPIARPHPPGTL